MMRYVSGELTSTSWKPSEEELLTEKKNKYIQALEATNLNLRGKHIDLDDFYATMMEDYIDEAKLEYKDGKKDPDI